METAKQDKKVSSMNSISPAANLLIILFFMIYACICLLPVLIVLAVSFTEQRTVTLEGYSLFPSKFSLDAYQYLWRNATQILRAYGVTVVVTIVGSLAGLFMTALYAYPISRSSFSFRHFFSFFIFFTMLFNGGLVPWYLVYTNLFDLRESILALIIPGLLMNAFFVIVMRTFFTTTIHPSIIESASIDGVSELGIFFRIVLPLSLPVLGTIGLFYTLGYWNDWFNSLVFVSREPVSLQYLMYKVMRSLQFLTSVNGSSLVKGDISKLPNETARMAMAILGMGPIVLAYPFFQKYFVKGLTIGAVKG
ncbi:carbohydrate ABC transporter permease [Paenibacillus sp. LHD-117]|uniref:carbohydrate ABC transporter permease n=1 Tax=Paenibacillus sp. LHD-117 TaxID=3071412 RepID=UPI0027E00CD8|nr:carbohydrate ABC transporter permease [Paenibacillus sp. LHD-117]MDQ6423599.1 carbohydrate ABC transporter permease [Paenibacillus sp. LHD-117]